MSIESQITQLDSSQLDNLFSEVPASTPNADTLAVGKEISDDKEVKVVKQDTNIPFVENIDDLEKEDTKDNEESIDDKKSKKEDKSKGAEDIENNNDDEAEDSDPAVVSEVLKNTVEYLINSGQWVDFDGREDLEITEEVYAELVARQDEYRVSQMFSELLDSTGDYGKAIISHIKQGGNPDEIIDLFKEHKQLESLDTSSEKGQEALIKKYYSEVLGWKDEKIERTIKRLVEDNEISSEFKDVEELYDQHYQKKLDEIREQTYEQERLARQKQAAFVNNIREALDEDSSIPNRDKALIASSILEPVGFPMVLSEINIQAVKAPAMVCTMNLGAGDKLFISSQSPMSPRINAGASIEVMRSKS